MKLKKQGNTAKISLIYGYVQFKSPRIVFLAHTFSVHRRGLQIFFFTVVKSRFWGEHDG
jgi:hypothetical protein